MVAVNLDQVKVSVANTNVIIVKHAIKFLISDCKIKLLHSLLYAVAI